MQYFVNHDQIDRAAGEVFHSERSRYYLLSMVAFATAAAAGPALAAIWLGLVLLVEETRRALMTRLDDIAPEQTRASQFALAAARAAALATAPALAWFSRSDLGPTLAVLLLSALMINAALFARRGATYAAIASAPYGALALIFLFDGAAAGDIGSAGACFLVIGFMFAAALRIARDRTHAERENAEVVRQLNAALNAGDAAAWEIDFGRRDLDGADRLAALLGRPISFDQIIDGAFAAPADRNLVRAAFAPQRGAFRRLAIEHAAFMPDGSPLRLRHEAVMRTTPDGQPWRLTGITRRVCVAEAGADGIGEINNRIEAAFATQNEILKTLANELSAPAPEAAGPQPAPNGPVEAVLGALADQMRAFAVREEIIETRVDQLAHARHAAESANLSKSQFLANMSHELRTPLNAIIGYTEILQEDAEDKSDAGALQDLARILTAARHLLSLINEILDLSKIEAGRMEVASAPFDPLEMINDLVDTMRPIAEQNGNHLSVTGAAFEGLATTDAMKMRQCLLNLLSNACKFTKNGTIEIALEQRAHSGVEQMFFIVRDTGIGMSREHLARLFQPFVQADPSITQQYGGTGLGLTITRRLAQLLGGDVSVESALSEGATFTLHVPINFADAAAALGAAAEIDAVQGPEGAPLVIVIEDEPDARDLAARALTRAGFAVQGVGGGDAGLALARSKAPALVLLDIYLPDRSGWRVLQALKHDPKTQDIPVIVLSVNEDRAHAMSLGAAEHIVKPAVRDMLAATVMRYARKRPQAQSAAEPIAAPALAHKHAG